MEHSGNDETLAPNVKTVFDELKEELESLKELNKKLVDAKEENVAEKVSKVIITKKAVGIRKPEKKI